MLGKLKQHVGQVTPHLLLCAAGTSTVCLQLALAELHQDIGRKVFVLCQQLFKHLDINEADLRLRHGCNTVLVDLVTKSGRQSQVGGRLHQRYDLLAGGTGEMYLGHSHAKENHIGGEDTLPDDGISFFEPDHRVAATQQLQLTIFHLNG